MGTKKLKKLLESFSKKDISDNFQEDWNDILMISEIIYNLGNFNDVGEHEKKLLNDVRVSIKHGILMFNKQKTISCITDFIVTYNLIFNG